MEHALNWINQSMESGHVAKTTDYVPWNVNQVLNLQLLLKQGWSALLIRIIIINIINVIIIFIIRINIINIIIVIIIVIVSLPGNGGVAGGWQSLQ